MRYIVYSIIHVYDFHIIFSSVWVTEGSIWERAAHSVDHMILVISSFGFEGGILVLIAPVPGHCILVTFTKPHHYLSPVVRKPAFLHMRKQRHRSASR